MTLVWDERSYETGVDRGVLYLPSAGPTYPGVAWNGLISVEEAPTEGEVLTKYMDGIGFLTVAVGRYTQVNVSAFSAPREFSDYIGEKLVVPGFHLTQQPKSRFNFSYRVLTDTGYQIHILYNCLATQSGESHATLGDSVEPEPLSWVFDATPAILQNTRPTAHFIIDPSVNPSLAATLEDLLYGTAIAEPNCPTPQALMTMFD